MIENRAYNVPTPENVPQLFAALLHGNPSIEAGVAFSIENVNDEGEALPELETVVIQPVGRISSSPRGYEIEGRRQGVVDSIAKLTVDSTVEPPIAVYSEAKEFRLGGPAEKLSRIDVVKDPDDFSKVFLKFIDIADDEPLSQVRTMVTAEFFARYTFQLWNAGQLAERVLARSTDVENKGIWLYQDARSDVTLESQAYNLLSDYYEQLSPDNEYLDGMVRTVEKQITKFLESEA